MIVRRKNEATRVYFLLYTSVGDPNPQTGEAANITARVGLDGAASTVFQGGANPAELDATNHPGVYYYDLSAAEMNYELVTLYLNHSTLFFLSATLEIRTDLRWENDVYGGSGFTAATDSLPGLASYFSANIANVLTRGTQVTELSGTGWLSRIATKAREWADQPALAAKFTGARILTMVQDATREMFTDVLLHSTKQIGVRHSITLVDGQYDYTLPPGVGQVLMVGSWSSETDFIDWELRPSTVYDPYSTGWHLEGNLIRFRTLQGLDATTIDVLYTPNGDIRPHVGTTLAAPTGATVTLPTTVTDGTLDTRPNAYAGYMFRALAGANMAQEVEVPVESYDAATRILTLRRPLSPAPIGGFTYELCPVYGHLFEDLLALHVARSMLVSIGKKSQYELVTQRFREKARALRLTMAKTQMREASRFDNRNIDNEEYYTFWRYF